jgi:cell division septal protein FtsQ
MFKLFTLPQWFLNPNIFKTYPNPSLVIEGNGILTPAKILTVLKPIKFKHKPLYLINTAPLQKALDKLSPVRKVYIRRFWMPARLEIVIEEKTPILSVALAPNSLDMAIIADDATIIGREFLPISNKLFPTYRIITKDDFFKWKPKQIKSLVVLSKIIESQAGEGLLYVDIRDPENVFAQTESVKIKVGDLSTTTKERIKRLGSIMPQIKGLKDKIDYIDLSWEKTTFIKLKNKQAYPLNKEDAQ